MFLWPDQELFKIKALDQLSSAQAFVNVRSATGALLGPRYHGIWTKLHRIQARMPHQPPRMPQGPLTSPLRLGMLLGSPCALLLEGVGGAPAFPAPPPRLFFLRFAPRLASVGLISIPRNTQTALRLQTAGSRLQCQALALRIRVKLNCIWEI